MATLLSTSVNGTLIASDYVQSTLSMYSPIYYDGNDSSFYLDANSTSRLYATWNTSMVYVGGSSAGSALNINFDQIWTNSGNLHLQYSGSGNIDMNYGGGYAFSRTSLRAPIFYDYQDSSYYLDPNGTSNLSTIYAYSYQGNGNVAGTGAASYHPSGIYSTGNNWLYGSLYMAGNNMADIGGITQNQIMGRPNVQWGASGSATGAVIIKFPGDTNNYGMVHAVIDIYEYNGNNVSTVIVGGHNWGSRWYSYGANVVGYTNKQVRVGVKDGKYCIIIGDGSSSWSYGQVVLRKIQNGSYYSGIMNVGSGYTIGIESDSYSWVSEDLRTFRSSGNIFMNESLVATQSWVNSQGYLSSVPSNYVTTSGGQTIGGITYFSNVESIQVYGIRGRFTNEYIHLYNKVGIGHPNGWGEGQGNTPAYGLSTYGGINIAYGNGASSSFNGYVRIDKNWAGGDYGAEQFTIRGTYPSIALRSTQHNNVWLIHNDDAISFYYGGDVDNNSWSRRFEIPTDGNIWMSWANNYISNLLDAKQNASTAINTSNIGSQSVSVARQLLSPNNTDVVAADSAMPNAASSFIHTLALGPSNNDGHILGMTWQNSSIYGAQIFLDTDPTDTMAIRSRSSTGAWTSWKTVMHSGNIGSQSVNYASSAGNADTVDGYHTADMGNRSFTRRGFTVNGDANTYYPVIIPGSAAFAFNRYSINRHYAATAPWDPIGTGVHKGGLTFDFEWSGDPAWGGNDHTLRVVQFSETYTTMVAGLALPVTGGVCVWLRGGGASYDIQVDGAAFTPTVYIGNFTAGNGAVFSPRTDTSNVNSEIYGRMPVRNSSELYDNGNRVITSGNISSQSVSYASTAGALTSMNISQFTNNSGYLTSLPSHNHDDRYYTETEVSNFFSGTTAITGYNKSNWDTAFGWGNHAGQGYATQTYVNTAVSNLVDTAPATLDTLNELAAALGDDPNFATTVTNSIATKAPLASPALTGTPTAPTASTATNSTQIATTAFVKAQGYITGYTETDTLASVTGRGATTSTPITVTATEGREVAIFLPSSYTTNDLVSGHEYGWYSDHWRLGMTRSSASPGADFVVQWNAVRRLSLSNSGNLTVTGAISATNFSGTSSGTNTGDQTTITGNAGSATVLQTSRTLTIGNTGKTFNGGANVSWSLAEIGAQPAGSYAAASHTHDDRYYTESESDGRYAYKAGAAGQDFSADRLSSYYLRSHSGVSANHPYGLYFDNGLSTAYAIYREGGPWDWPYPDLRIAFHTGIKIGANAGYGGIKFYNDYDMASQVMSVNNAGDPLGGNNVYVNNSLQAGSSLRAPIFYDSDDTNYYLDPNSASRLNSLTTTGRIYSNEWIQFDNNSGLYSPTNGAHFRPNFGSYGAWKIEGQRNGYNGFQFETSSTSVSLMISTDANTSGFHNNGYGWQFSWSNGTLYCNKNSYGGGTAAVVLDSSNYTSYVTVPTPVTSGPYIENGNPTSTFNSAIQAFSYTTGTPPYEIPFESFGLYNEESDYNGFPSRRHNSSFDALLLRMFREDLDVISGNTARNLRMSAGRAEFTFTGPNANFNTTSYIDSASVNFSGPASSYLSLWVGFKASIYDNSNKFVEWRPYSGNGDLYVTGQVYANQFSDAKYKDNVTPIDNALEKVKAIPGVEFTWNALAEEDINKEGTEVGVIAQQVQAVYPQAVREVVIEKEDSATSALVVDYEKLLPLALQSIRELTAMVEQLQEEVNLLKAK